MKIDSPQGLSRSQLIKQQYRRMKNDQTRTILRPSCQEFSSEAAINKAFEGFQYLSTLLSRSLSLDMTERKKMRIILKQLKQLSCLGLAPKIFTQQNYIAILFQIQNKAVHELSLDDYSLDFVHMMLINLTGNTQNKNVLSLKQLSLNHLQSNRPTTIDFILQICGNFLSRDVTKDSIYHLICKQRSNIVQRLLEMLINSPNLYERIESTLLWFMRILIISISKSNYEQFVENSYNSLISLILYKVSGRIKNIQRSQHRHQNSFNQLASKNELLRTLKVLLKSQKIQLDQELILCLESEDIFDPFNIQLVTILYILTFQTLYSLKKQHIRILLQYLFNNMKTAPQTILTLICNSLINDPQHAKDVLQLFIRYSSIRGLNEDLLDFDRFPNTAYFAFYLNEPDSEYEICEIIGSIVYFQGGFGVLQECVEQIASTYHGAKKLQSLGIEL